MINRYKAWIPAAIVLAIIAGTTEAVRHKVRATTRELPFFNPPRKTATPIV
jgi:hypothetical protein